jgi:AcrR family transcriptional regulator
MRKDTRGALIKAARELFARDGYDGASVRAIVRRARVNLGAITYYFGSKRALYEAVVGEVVAPSREWIGAVADRSGPALGRVELVVRTLFEYLSENPDLPRLMMQAMVSSRPIPKPALETIQANTNALTAVITEGQKDGTIRPGDPQLMALRVGAQPLWLAFARRALTAGVGIDPVEPETRKQLVEGAVQFVRAGLEVRRGTETRSRG